MRKLLTIVVPVYKVEQYINKCLESLILKDDSMMEQLEVIIVNDGTPDRSAEMSREYVKRYPDTFRQIDKENKGHGSAWNIGLKEASGKYLRFLDSDDWLTNLDKLMEKLQTSDADVIVTKVSVFDAKRNYSRVKDSFKEIEAQELPIKSKPFNAGISNFWYATYKLSMLKPYHPLFLEGVSYDDTILCVVPYLIAKSFIAYDFVLYNYLQGREGQSVSIKVVQEKINDQFANYKHMVSFAEKTKGGIDIFIEEVLADYRRKLFNVTPTFSDYAKSCSAMRQLEKLGNLGGIGGRDYWLYKMLPYRIFYSFERTKDKVKRLLHR